MRKFIFLLLIVFAFVQARAVQIEGRAFNSDLKEGEPFATVRIFSDKSDKPVAMMVTDVDGNFSINLDKPGNYRLELSAVTKKPAVKSFTVGSDPVVSLGDIDLENDTKNLDEVVVVAQRPLVQMTTDQMTYNISEDTDSRTYTLLEMLRKVPMVTVDGEDNITVNGSSNFQVYVDGKPSLMFSSNPSQLFKAMPASAVQRIEVVTNPGAKYDAEGVGGVLNLVMNKVAGADAATDLKAYNVSVGVRGSNRGFGGNIYANGQIGRFSASLNIMHNQMFPGSTLMTTTRTEGDLVTDAYTKGKPRMPFTMGNLSLEYNIDALTTLGATFSVNRFANSSKSIINTSLSAGGAGIFNYLNDSHIKGSRQGINGSVSLSRKFDSEGHNNLNVTYQIAHENQDNLTSNDFTVVFPADLEMDSRTSDSKMKTTEQIALADFSSNFGNNTVSVGLKGTFRNAAADNTYLINDITDPSGSLDYENKSNIGAAYGEYSFHNMRFSAKAGLRYEHTWQSIDYNSDAISGYKENYGNFVPSASIGYNLGMTSHIGINYNMRISRPGISYLNPFVNQADPTQISYGNPNLDVEKTQNVSLVYNLFSPKFSLNVTLSHAYTGNGIEQYSFMDEGVMNTTYGNIVKKNNSSLNAYVNWLIGTKTRIFLNGGLSYVSLRSKELNASNHGFQGMAMLGVQQQLPWDIKGNVFLMASTKNRTLQGWNTGFRMINVNFSKSFLNDKLGVSIGFNTGLSKGGKTVMDTYVSTPTFTNRTKIRLPMTAVNLGITFKFGNSEKLREIRNTRLDNDFIDTKSQMENISNSEGTPGM